MQPISILIPTCNRLSRLTACINSVWESLSLRDEIIIWNNASTDGTKEYLDKIVTSTILNIRVVNSDKNIGLSAVNRGFEMMENDYMVKIDDDVIKVPFPWKQDLLEVFEKVPKAGYISAALKNDRHLPQAFFNEYNDPTKYERKTINGIPLRIGGASGGFVMTTRAVYEDVGGFVDMEKDGIFYFNEDSDYSEKCKQKGYITGFREDLEVFHAFGPYYNREYKQNYIEKYANWLAQAGLKNKSREEKEEHLKAFSVDDKSIREEILK